MAFPLAGNTDDPMEFILSLHRYEKPTSHEIISYSVLLITRHIF